MHANDHCVEWKWEITRTTIHFVWTWNLESFVVHSFLSLFFAVLCVCVFLSLFFCWLESCRQTEYNYKYPNNGKYNRAQFGPANTNTMLWTVATLCRYYYFIIDWHRVPSFCLTFYWPIVCEREREREQTNVNKYRVIYNIIAVVDVWCAHECFFHHINDFAGREKISGSVGGVGTVANGQMHPSEVYVFI